MRDSFLLQQVEDGFYAGERKSSSKLALFLYQVSKGDMNKPKAATHICEHGNYYKQGVHDKWFVWRDNDWLSVRADVRVMHRTLSSAITAPLNSEQRSGGAKQLLDSNARMTPISVTHKGETLKQMRLQAGLSRHDAAKSLNVSVSTVGRLEAVNSKYTMRYCYTQYRDFLLTRS